ncbi:ABC transporter substrate-binding protein [Mesorhizobium sp. M1312]|uniref:ABC transporter substrate-binding protein n=1 Tax=unclassified Mesorhizobium TaxID=325217 RepID=UPI003337D410
MRWVPAGGSSPSIAAAKYPASVAQKPSVGYRRQLSVEGLVALRPDLILAAQDSGPPEAIEVLKSLAIPVVFVPEDNSQQGIERKITLIAAALRLEDKGRIQGTCSTPSRPPLISPRKLRPNAARRWCSSTASCG